ncbi:ABC transporter permease [Hyphomonas sp.]|uniref:ABC transporter permease n=1 Tax=Hyphomonas sp. TaxID=87 RepID=UPI00261EC6F5|nr:ABC transporter permease [Hyphomonas sp.]MDF1732029.1 ABC transporter permease [Minwuia sp.]MDF1806795.1 ABC transporter permease [Hyphomonas sp.]
MTTSSSGFTPLGWTKRILVQPSTLLPLAAVLAAVTIGGVVILAMGVAPGKALAAFSTGAFGSPYAIAVSINRAVIFALIGLGFILANRANLTNVGGEGQIAVGGIAATAVALYGGVDGFGFGLAIILPMLAATVSGAVWGGIAGLLRVRAGTNEVISTLLLSFIAIWLVYWCVQSEDLLRQPMTTSATLPESAEIPISTQLPLLTGDYSSPVTVGLPIALILALIGAVVLRSSRFGFNLRVVGLNSVAAARAGIAQRSTIVWALTIAGAFGGLAGAIMLLGEQYSLKTGFSSGYGFDGLVVGLLARGSVVGVLAGALLFGFLRSGGIGMEMGAAVPSAVVSVIQGLIVVFVAGAAFWLDRKEKAR